MEKIKTFFRSIKYGIENLIIWTSVIWKDRNWDHWYLYKILQFKLIQMEKLHRKYGHAVNSIKTADQIKICINLLKRLIEDDYDESIFKNHNKKWGEAHFNWDECKDRKDCRSLRITRDNVKTDKEIKQERKEFNRLCKHEAKLRKQDNDYLFKLMNKYIQGWWD
ncbi:MAG: hypothetical protein ACTSWK_00270 [Promethearchaeota archaeon]